MACDKVHPIIGIGVVVLVSRLKMQNRISLKVSSQKHDVSGNLYIFDVEAKLEEQINNNYILLIIIICGFDDA